ncbi:MAG: phosphatidylinositol mannoside acyltransferase [Actinobacteria bacterium]|nr:phosphatidylinositol mannoside acyltransferase [Actinomycetota bacterium]
MIEKLSVLSYFAGWRIVRFLPENMAYGLFRKIADLITNKNGGDVKRLRENLRRVKPGLSARELDDLVQRGMRSYLRYWCDTFRIQDWSQERIQSTVSLTNGHLLIDSVKEGRGVVIALPHSGNWDHAGAYFCSIGIPLVTVAEHLKPEALFNRFLEYRTSMGFEVLDLDSRSFVTLIRRAKEKRLIALVADRDLSKSGIDVDFFDHPARMPAGPALLAIKTGIPLVVAHVSYTAQGIHIEFNEVRVPIDGTETERIQKTVQASADLFARGIAQSPEDWHMLQRIWVDGDFKERE